MNDAKNIVKDIMKSRTLKHSKKKSQDNPFINKSLKNIQKVYKKISQQIFSETDESDENQFYPANTKDIQTKPRENYNHIFINTTNGNIFEYSIEKKKIVFDFQNQLFDHISWVATSGNKKHLFAISNNGYIIELDVRSHKRIKSFDNKGKATKVLVTYDSQFLFTCTDTGNLKKWCMKTNKPLHIWSNDTNKEIQA